MPVSSQQLEYAKGIVDALSENPRTGEPAYTRMKRIKPKGLRGSILKHIGWPTSWAALYDLSPAQISQNREPEKAREVWGFDSDRLDRVNVWKILLRGYFNNDPDPMSESAFPRWRKPSWMSESNAQSIRDLISNAYENEGVSQYDRQIGQAQEATEDVPREQRMADLAEQEEAQAPQVDDTANNTERRVTGRQLSDSLFALYGSYWRNAHGIVGEERLYNAFVEEAADVKRAAVVIFTLEGLGYEYRGIEAFTTAMGQKKMQLYGTRPGRNSGHGAYLMVDLKGANDGTRRYRSSTSYAIMSATSRVPESDLRAQFSRPVGTVSRSELQTFRFTGSGYSLGGFQLLSLNYINGESNTMDLAEGRQKLAQAYNRAVSSYDSITDPTTTQAESTTTTATANDVAPVSSIDVMRLFAVQRFAPGQTFRQQGELFETGGMNGQDGSLVFYFAKLRANGIDFFRARWGQTTMRIPAFSVRRTMAIEGLKRQWNESGRLNTPNEIAIEAVPQADIRPLAQAYLNVTDEAISQGSFGVTRGSGSMEQLNFDQIERTDEGMMGQLEDYFRNVVDSTSSEQADSGEDIRAEVKSKKMDRTFGYEIEGNFLSALNSDPTTNDLNKREARKILTKNITEVLDERGINEMEFRRRFMINPESVPEEYRVMANGYGSIDLMGDISVAGGNAFEVASPVFIPPNDEKSKSGISRRISSAQYEAQQFKTDADMWKWVAVFSEALLRSQVQIHKSAGLHIHVSIEDYNTDDKKRYLENYAGFEPLIDLMMPINSRVGGRSFNSSIIQQGEIRSGGYTGGSTPQESPSSWRRTGRTGRSKVRTETGKGTIEFRHPMANIENDYIHHMVELAYRLVEVSKSYQFTSFKWKDLSSILPTETATFLYNRIEDMAMPKFESREAMRKFFKNNEPIRARYGGEKSSGSELKRRRLQ